MNARIELTHPIEPFMAGLKFPADKDHVLETALHNHVPKDVLDLLEQFQRQHFVVPQDVIEAYEELRGQKPARG